MKKLNKGLILLFLLIHSSIWCQVILTPTILPQNPTNNSNINLVFQFNTSSGGSELYLGVNADTIQKIIDITGCYGGGMLAQPIAFTNTLNIGILPVGTYTVRMKAYLSFSSNFCSKSDSVMLNYIFTVNSSIVISSCNAPDSIVKKYKDDADRLAVRRVFHVNSTFKDSIEINKPISKNYQNALLAVYNATTLPARDTVVNAFKIHAYCNPGMNYIVVQADTNTSWVKNLIHNIIPTGQAQFDNLYNKYYLQKIYYFGFSPIQYIVMKTDTNYNTDALSQKFGLISGVTAYADDCFSDVRDITDSINSNFTLLTYKYGWGDCPSGCGSHRYWQFKIFNNCSVEYLGSYGDPITPPAFVGLQEHKASVDNVQIYPNPIKGKLNVEFIIQPQISYLNITNSFGQLIFEKNNLNQKEEIDLSFLHSGIYYLKVQNNSEQKIFKIIKE